MRSKLSFHKQEKPYSCAVACLKMILNFYGLTIDEKTIREKCKTTTLGTYADDLIKCARELGFEAKKEYTDFNSLKESLNSKIFPIVYVNLLFLERINCTHAVIIEELGNDYVRILDPSEGRKKVEMDQFRKSWEMTRNLAITVYKR